MCVKQGICPKINFILPLILLPIFCNAEKILIFIDHVVREVDSQDNTPCLSSEWGKGLTNVCKCCLVKKIPAFIQGKKTAQEVTNECIAKNYCSQDHINSLKGSSTLEESLRAIYNSTVLIKKIDTQGINLDSQGNLTEAGATAILEKMYAEGKLPYKEFESVKCFKSKDIFTEARGVNTTQLFTVHSQCTPLQASYILKEMPGGFEEAKNLAKFLNEKKVLELTVSPGKPFLPVLSIPIAYFQYEYAGKKHFLALMPIAEGIEASKYMGKYFSNPSTENKRQVYQVYFDIGYALSKFHQAFMDKGESSLGQTIVHGDFHHRNIFYDEKTRKTTFIDNENMTRTFHNLKPVFSDINTFIFFPALEDQLNPKEVRGLDKNKWLQLVMEPFLKGYIAAFEEKDRKNVFSQISKEVESYYRLSNQWKATVSTELNKISAIVAKNDFPELKDINASVEMTKVLSPEDVKNIKNKLSDLTKALENLASAL